MAISAIFYDFEEDSKIWPRRVNQYQALFFTPITSVDGLHKLLEESNSLDELGVPTSEAATISPSLHTIIIIINYHANARKVYPATFT